MFLFLFLSPWSNSSLPNSALTGLHISFLEETETTLSSVFVEKTTGQGQGQGQGQCFYIDLPADIFEYVDTGSKSLVRELGGEGILSDLTGSKLVLGSQSDFFRVAISPEFSSQALPDCQTIHNYNLGSVVEMKIVSYTKLGMMRVEYDNNYNELKQSLKVADIFDFAIVFEGLSEMDMEPSMEISSVVEILAKEYVVKVLKSNGEISNERISLRIW
jgi:hypothetical protein